MAREKADRKKRIPLGVHRQKLTVSNVPEGKVLRWVNDDPGRISEAQAGGYEFVQQDGTVFVGTTGEENQAIDSRVSRNVKVSDRGEPVRAYLMAIDKDNYDADQAVKQEELDRVDDAIRNGTHATDKLGGKSYVPRTGIKYSRD